MNLRFLTCFELLFRCQLSSSGPSIPKKIRSSSPSESRRQAFVKSLPGILLCLQSSGADLDALLIALALLVDLAGRARCLRAIGPTLVAAIRGVVLGDAGMEGRKVKGKPLRDCWRTTNQGLFGDYSENRR